MSHFTPFSSLAGGVVIGLASAVLLLGGGHLAGISGIAAGLLGRPRREGDEWTWRALFTLGLCLTGGLLYFVLPGHFGGALPRSTGALMLAGLLVGTGTRLAGGCTSGHGICGLARFSGRSLVAVLVFMGTGALTVFAVNRLLGGAL